MNDAQKTRAELLEENAQLRQQLAEMAKAVNPQRESENQYRQLFESLPIPAVIHAHNHIFLINPAAIHILGGAAPDDFIGEPICDFIHPDTYAPQTIEKIAWQHGESPTRELRLIHLDGTTIEIMGKVLPVDYAGQAAVQVVFINITENSRLRPHCARVRSAIVHSLKTPP